jgi:hypothetical protein
LFRLGNKFKAPLFTTHWSAIPAKNEFVHGSEFSWNVNSKLTQDDFNDLNNLLFYGRMSHIRLIPPPGTQVLTGKPSLFTASARMIQNYCNIEEEKVPEVLDALEAWRTERTLLSDSLDEEMLQKLKSGLATTESGLLTVNIEAPAEDPRPFSRLVFSFPAFKIAGPDNELIEYLEWNFY